MQYNKYRSLCTAQGAWHPATELQPTGGNTQENQTSSWKMQTWGIMNLQREVTLMKHYRKQLDRFKLSWHPWNVVPINQDYSLTVKSVSKRLDIKRHRGCCSCSFAVCLWNHKTTAHRQRCWTRPCFTIPSPDILMKTTCLFLLPFLTSLSLYLDISGLMTWNLFTMTKYCILLSSHLFNYLSLLIISKDMRVS